MTDAKSRATFAAEQARWESPPDDVPECSQCGGGRDDPQTIDRELVDEDGEPFIESETCEHRFHNPPDGEDEYERRRR